MSIEELVKKHAGEWGEYTQLAVESSIRAALSALLDYGNHKHDFGALSEQTCTCGFSAALWG